MSADPGKIRRDVAEQSAREKGCIVVEPKPNELFIDIDFEEDLEYFKKQITRIQVRWPCTWCIVDSPSRRPGRYHVYVVFEGDKPLDHWQRIALQCVLGSDRIRELISVQRLLDGDAQPTLFFERAESGRPELVVAK